MPFVAGNEIDAFCTPCNRDGKHTVIEVHGGLVQEVRCMHCKEQHRYQRPHAPPPPARKAATPRAKPRRKAATRKPVEVGPPQEWQDKVMARVPEHARPYSLQETFVVDDIVDHKTFGLGVVTVVAPDRKIEVAFRDGRKKLAHSR